MEIVFVSLALNIHQVGISDELYKLTKGNFWFVETGYNSEFERKGGENEFSSRPYLLSAFKSSKSYEVCLQKVRECDIMIYGPSNFSFFKERIKTGKVTFLYSERWFKRGWLNLFSPRLIQQMFFYHLHCHEKPVYLLCASAYAAQDFNKMWAFKGRAYKWGYFTSVPTRYNIEDIMQKKEASIVKILWVGRFLQWKHPERMLPLALFLKNKGINFVIDMIGAGPEFDKISRRISEGGLDGFVNLLGAVSNYEVIAAMLSHHIFCFTSDKNEGWGAVLNEAMSCGCCPVGSIDAGSVPYLIRDGVNGLSFSFGKENYFYENVLRLIQNAKEREHMSVEAYNTIHNVWSPLNAASQFYSLCESFVNGDDLIIAEGPCSKAK